MDDLVDECQGAASGRVLVAFDFDHTVVDANSDTWVYKALPSGALPDDIKALYQPGQWTRFMNDVFEHCHQEGVTPACMEAVMRGVPLTPGMAELLSFLGESPEFECVIVSDANTLFIEWILASHGLTRTFSRVFTNPAQWTSMEPGPGGGGSLPRLTVDHHHAHGCGTCHVNLCKRAVLQGLIAEQAASSDSGGAYDRILYVGDGGNDLCPATLLSPQDAVFARAGYPLAKALRAQQEAREGREEAQQGQQGQSTATAVDGPDYGERGRPHGAVACRVVEWDDARTVLDWIRANVSTSPVAGRS
ncbi:hypothetical protein FOA52_012683 [Chlamydomonas sp. UWO 241]|nr:hypothetical protein FOA52_012683 [Chlamydomonas sp. UWO 241]